MYRAPANIATGLYISHDQAFSLKKLKPCGKLGSWHSREARII